MQLNQEIAKEVKERLLAMCTHDCGAFMRFRHILESDIHSADAAKYIDDVLFKLNVLLRHCGAGTNGDY